MNTHLNRFLLLVLCAWVTLGDGVIPAGVAHGLLEAPPDPHPISGELPQPVGQIDGSLSVDPSGNANYTMPIVVPPGRNGMEPHLAIAYSSGAGNGTLGLGWSLTGLSFMGPCNHPVHHLNAKQKYTGTAHPALCIDGIPIAPQGTNLATHKPESYVAVPDMHYRLDIGTSTKRFRDPQGRLYTYDSDSKLGQWGQRPIIRAEDPDGNYIEYEWDYANDGWWYSGENDAVPIAIKRIRYTGNSKTGTPPTKTIEFSYDDARPDPHHRNNLVHDRLLTKITITNDLGPDDKPRWYELSYTTSRVGVSLLMSAQECVARARGSKVCKSPTMFEYQLPESGFHTTETTLGAGVGHPDPCHGPFAVDLNGDGLDDLLWGNDCGSGFMQAVYSHPPGSESPTPPGTPVHAPEVWPSPKLDWVPVSLTNDIRVDGLSLADDRKSFHAMSNFAQGGYIDNKTRPIVGDEVDEFFTVDITGDGITDVISCETVDDTSDVAKWFWYQGDGHGGFRPGQVIKTTQLPNYYVDPNNLEQDLRCLKGRVEIGWDAQTATSTELHLEFATSDDKPDKTYAGEIRRSNVTGEPFGILYANEAFIPWWSEFKEYGGYVDPNNDGIPDGISCREWPSFEATIHFGRMRGANDNSPTYNLPWNPDVDFAALNPAPTSCDIDAVDLNRDGFLDLRFGNQIFAYDKQNRNFSFAGTLPSSSITIGDFDGDGRDDIVYHASGDWVLRSGNPPVLDGVPSKGADHLLRRVTTGLGRVQELEYGHLTDYDLHRPENWVAQPLGIQDPEPCPLPARCMLDGRSLVASIRDNPASDSPLRIVHYSYEGARVDAWSGEWLGFRRVSQREQLPDGSVIARHTLFENESHTYGDSLLAPGTATYKGFLLSGLPTKEVTIVDQPGGRDLANVVEYTWELRDSAQESVFVALMRVVRKSFDEPGGTFVDENMKPESLVGVTPMTEGVSEITDYDAYGNPLGFIITMGPERQAEVHFSYAVDTENWLLRRVDTETAVLSDLETHTTKYVYDTGGAPHRLVRTERQPDGPDDQRLRTAYEYDPYGNVSLITRHAPAEPLSTLRRTYVRYDEDEHTYPREVENELGHVTSYDWDPVLGVPFRTTDPFGVTNWTKYDGFGRVLKQSLMSRAGEMLEMQTAFVHYRDSGTWPEPSRMRTRRINSLGASVDELYGENGRLIHRTWDTATDPGEAEQLWRYDAFGRVTRQTNPAFVGAPTKMLELEYDALGRLRKRTLPGGATQRIEHEGLITRVFDAKPANPPWEFKSNANGELAETIDPLGTAFCYEYDSHGLVSQIHKACNGGSAAEIVTYERDVLGRLIFSDDPGQGPGSYEYDAYDQLRRLFDGEGQMTEFEYDVIGRPIRQTAVGETRRWTYDEMPESWQPPPNWSGGHEVPGMLVSLSSSIAVRYDYEYDTFGQLTEEHLRFGRSLGTKVYSTLYEHDDYGRLSTLQYPTHLSEQPFRVSHTYAPTGELNRLEDADTGSELWKLLRMDAAGRVELERHGNGLETETERDADGRPRRIRTGVPQGGGGWANLKQDYEYAYDSNGNLDWRRDHLQSALELFDYDELNRLTRAANLNPDGIVDEPATWTIDEFGNIDYRSDIGSIVSEPNGRLISVAGEPVEYDGNGNMVVLGSELEIDWWASGQPAMIQDSEATIELHYGPRDELIRRRHADEGDSFHIGPHYQVQTSPKGSDNPTEMVNYVHAHGRAVAVKDHWRGPSGSGTQFLFPHSDGHGSVNVATEANATTSPDVQRSYGPWGAVRPLNWLDASAEPELSKVNIGYTGHRAKPNGPLIDMGGRQYHPGLGRFPSADPMTMGVFDTQAWNRFSYVRNNPTTFVDPSGYSLCDIGYICGSNPMEFGGSLLVATIINVARTIRRAVNMRGSNAPGAPPATAVQVEQKKNAFLFRDTPGAWSVGDYQQVSNGLQPYQQNLAKPGIASVLQNAYTDVLAFELPSAGELALGYVDFHVSSYRFFAGKVDERLDQAAYIRDNWHLLPQTFVQGIANDVHNVTVQIPAIAGSVRNKQWGAALEQYMSAGESAWSLAAHATGAGSVRQTVLKTAAKSTAKTTAAKGLPDSALVCRGGTCTAERFAKGSGVSVDSAGKLQGVSVNSAPGASVKELSKTIPNKQVGVTTVGDVRAAGGNVVPSGRPGNPTHCTMCGITRQQAEQLFTPTVRNPNL
jgi:RHS repeat-associated protein